MKKKKNVSYKNNYKFINSANINNATYIDYLNRFRKLCLSMFEWVNLPSTMSSKFLERTLYEDGTCALLYDESMGGFINTRCSPSSMMNIYEEATHYNCYSIGYNTIRSLYTGELINLPKESECIIVDNDCDKMPTMGSMELFAYRLYEAEQTALVNVIAQKTPVILVR